MIDTLNGSCAFGYPSKRELRKRFVSDVCSCSALLGFVQGNYPSLKVASSYMLRTWFKALLSQCGYSWKYVSYFGVMDFQECFCSILGLPFLFDGDSGYGI